MRRKLKLSYQDGQPVSRQEVVVRKGDDEVRTETDDRGRCEFDWPHDWADRLEVEQVVVKRDWDLSGGLFGSPQSDLGELKLVRPGSERDADIERRLDDEPERGIRGLIFYPDG